jgi:hypothetical protein
MRALVSLSLALAFAAPTIALAGQSAPAQKAPPSAEISELTLSQVAMAEGPLSRATIRGAVSSQSPLPRSVSMRVGGAVPVSTRAVLRPPVVTDPAALCETAVTTAEYVNHLPARMLGAISLTESGRLDAAAGRTRPWPWTINAEGEGQFFETKEAAIAAVKALQDRGVQSVDVGCLQVNLMYHPSAFASLEAAFDPRSNANYAAHFLNALFADSRDWPTAIAAYHSETPALGDAYRVLVMARWQNGDTHAPVVAVPAVAYGDFAQSGKVYGDKTDGDRAYGAFAPRSQVYGAFAPK